MLMAPLSLLSLVLLSKSSYAVPLNRRALPTLKVVTNPTGSLDACTPGQVNTLKAALAEGASLATKAATALSQTGAETSDAATKWLGTIKVATLATQVTKRLTNPAAAFRSTLTEVANFDADDAVYFYCPDINDPANNPCKATSDAVTENLLTRSDQNMIALCDGFFDGATLAADTTAYKSAVRAKGETTVDFPFPRSKGVILVHEAQHSLPILQSTTLSDNLQDRASTPEQSAKLASSFLKRTNAENWALLALLAEIDPNRLTCGTSSGSAGKRAASSFNGGAVCPLRSNSTSSSSSVSSSATSVSSSASATSLPVTTSAIITSKGTTSAPATSTPSATAKPTTAPATPPAAPPAAPATPPAAPAKPPTAPVKPPTVPVKPSKPKKGIKLIRRL